MTSPTKLSEVESAAYAMYPNNEACRIAFSEGESYGNAKGKREAIKEVIEFLKNASDVEYNESGNSEDYCGILTAMAAIHYHFAENNKDGLE